MIHTLLLLIALFAPQVDPVKNMHYMPITPVRWQHNQPMVDRLYAFTSFDNQVDAATVGYQLCVTPQPDTWAYIVASGTYPLTGSDYTAFKEQGIDYLFTYLADSSRLNIEIE